MDDCIIEYKTSDFVQVKHQIILPSGEPATLWRNALYNRRVGRRSHAVIYVDGTKEVLANNSRLRKPPKDE